MAAGLVTETHTGTPLSNVKHSNSCSSICITKSTSDSDGNNPALPKKISNKEKNGNLHMSALKHGPESRVRSAGYAWHLPINNR